MVDREYSTIEFRLYSDDVWIDHLQIHTKREKERGLQPYPSGGERTPQNVAKGLPRLGGLVLVNTCNMYIIS